MQNDFCLGGSLAVPTAEQIIEPINKLLVASSDTICPVFATRDWHPAQSNHFRDYGGTWPTHCVAGTSGAAFHTELGLDTNVVIISKGTECDTDGYSAFDGINSDDLSLLEALRGIQVEELLVCGLATDYCVQASVLDALERGFRVSVVNDAIAAVNLKTGDGNAALIRMRAAGAHTISTTEALYKLAAL